ncbi:DUF4148 domain-containing protein [Paraburkholderia phosphatilytica]|uniref:DUF4148 domain-containing protein n=1 Tax=Paraburkholderia phosphatilytica TaxID=2282883 RepID=UPI000E51838A|nr:DUF4148 domain-containing protein [Paraburkholderia phosphatilytica]
MNPTTKLLAIAALIGSTLCFAQQSVAAVTRTQVREELAQLEKAGYRPAFGRDNKYPDDLKAAEARVAAAKGGAGAGQSAGNQGQPAAN